LENKRKEGKNNLIRKLVTEMELTTQSEASSGGYPTWNRHDRCLSVCNKWFHYCKQQWSDSRQHFLMIHICSEFLLAPQKHCRARLTSTLTSFLHDIYLKNNVLVFVSDTIYY